MKIKLKTKSSIFFALAGLVLFVSSFLPPISSYGVVAFAAEPEFTVVNTSAISDTKRPTISNNIIAFKYNGSVGYIDISNSKVVYTSTYCHDLSPEVSDNFITFIQREDLAGIDLNGDRDFTDYVPVVLNVLTGELINTRGPLSISFPFNVSGDKVAYSIFESGAGVDLNGDNDLKDDVLAYFDIPSQTLINLRMQIVGVPIISNRIIVFSTTGLYPSYYDLQTREIFDTQIRATLGSFSVDYDKFAFTTSEVYLGTDLNGDGDTSDYIVRYYDTSRRQVFSTGAEVTNKYVAVPGISGNIIAFATPEAVVGPLGQDLNGDGDKLDNVVRYYDISTGRIVNTKAETVSAQPVVSGNTIAFVSYEGSVGPLGVDLNGDGDKFDYIVRYYDVPTGTLVNTGAEVSDFDVNISNNIIAFTTMEYAIGRYGIDINGNGNTNDRIIRYVIVGGEIPTFPPTASFTATPPTTGDAPLTVQFTDASTNSPISWQWDFDNNGTMDSTDKNPSYIYATPNTYAVSLKVSNSAGEDTETKQNYITVTQPNRNPVLDPIGDKPVNENQLLSFPVSASDLNGDTLTYTADGLPSGSSFNSSTKVFSWTPDFSQGNPSSKDYSLTFNVYDGRGGYDNETIKITVNNVNRSPTLDHINNQTVDEGKLLTFSINATDLDGDTLTYSTSPLPSGASFDSPTKVFSWTPDFSQGTKDYSVTFSVTDNKSPLVSQTITITVQNIPPTASFTATPPTTGNAPLSVNFTDASTNNPTSWKWDFDNNGVIDSTLQNPSHTYNTPNTYTVSLTVSNTAGSNTKTISNYITVTQPNRNPVLDPIGDKPVNENQLLSFTINATDLDGDTLTYTADGLPSGSSFNPATKVFSWTPDYAQSSGSPYSLTFNVYDGRGGYDNETIKITVNNVNRSPTLDHINNQTVDEGKLLTFTINATDLDGDPLTYSTSPLPSGASFDSPTKVFSWTPDFSQGTKDYSVTFSVTDSKSPLVSQTITITVKDVVIPPTYQCSDNMDNDNDGLIDLNDPGCASTTDNDETDIPPVDNPPTACVTNPGQTVQAGTLVYLNGSCSSDADNDPLSYQWSQTSGTSVNLANSASAISSFTAPDPQISQGLVNSLALSARVVLEFLGLISAQESQETLEFRLTVTAKDKPDSAPAQVIVTPKPTYQCSDGLDNDNDGLIDLNDLGCTSSTDNDETNSVSPPLISITNPPDNGLVQPRSLVSITTEVSSPQPITRVEFYINGSKKHTDRVYPYSYNWRVPRKHPASYQIQAKLYVKNPLSKGQIMVDQSETITVRAE